MYRMHNSMTDHATAHDLPVQLRLIHQHARAFASHIKSMNTPGPLPPSGRLGITVPTGEKLLGTPVTGPVAFVQPCFPQLVKLSLQAALSE